MALISMAVYDTEENKRTDLTARTLESLLSTVNWSKHRLVVIDNNSCEKTKHLLTSYLVANSFNRALSVIKNDKNVGTAKAVNQGLRLRQPGEFCIKMDNDVEFFKSGWVDEMEEVITRMPKIGILGLKRRDLTESVYAINTDQRTKLIEVPHEHGQRWFVFEQARMVMGTCTMFNPALLDRIGYMYQMDGLYGFDDSLMCVRAEVSGFVNGFHLGVDVDHIDPGTTDYQKWKERYAGDMLMKFAEAEQSYRSGVKAVFYDGE
jgi:GT2 family glycosyltransferase